MLPELGHFSLILALCTAVLLATVPLVGNATGQIAWMRLARPAAGLLLFFSGLSYACLTWAFISHDFSVAYVANTSNSGLPLMYLISGVWGGHEGSILFWCFILALWTGAVAVFGRNIPAPLLARVLAVLGAIAVGFLLFVLLTSNPFERLAPVPIDGASLNPLLQDPGMAIHPPILYMGYVGFAVAFAFAVAALLGGRLDSATLRFMRPWTNIAWAFLTIGISLGSFWAYYELGWGGWWFWDPVENASFMPWLVGTALIHSLAASEKRGVFKAWTVLLAVLAFSLSLLGTFLVRSGVLTSVHSFATDPARGLYILLFLGIVIGGSLLLYAARAHTLKSDARWTLVSRESGILVNNVLMTVAAAAVLLGTLFPLVVDSLGQGKISVGAPYFNAVFVPLMLPVLVVVGIGSTLNWKRDELASRSKTWIVLAALSVVAAAAIGFVFRFGEAPLEPSAVAALALTFWLLGTVAYGLWHRVRNKRRKLSATMQAPAAFWGMMLAHLGIGVFTLGAALVSIHAEEVTVRMAPGDSHEVGGYAFRFVDLTEVRGPNYNAIEAVFDVSAVGSSAVPTQLSAQKRVYDVRRETMTEAGIDGRMGRDLFIALGEPLDGGAAWSVRLQYKPMIRWIWLGTVLMALGGVVAAMDRRYRTARKRVAATARSGAGKAPAAPIGSAVHAAESLR